MKKAMSIRSVILLLTLLLFSVPSYSQRVRESFDWNWQFHKGDIAIKLAVKAGMQGGLSDVNVKRVEGEEVIIAYTDRNKVAEYKPADWQDVNLPHDWLVEEPIVHDNNIGSQPAGNGFRPTGIGFYRKEFEIPESDKGKKISIEFDGIFRNSTVWVNGHLMGNHPSGYVPSSYDLSDVLRYGSEGRNVILVKVDATDYEGWWYEGSGIYRHVWLIKTDKIHVARYGTFVTTPSISDKEAVVNIKTTLQNEYKSVKSVTLVSKIVDAQGQVLDRLTSSHCGRWSISHSGYPSGHCREDHPRRKAYARRAYCPRCASWTRSSVYPSVWSCPVVKEKNISRSVRPVAVCRQSHRWSTVPDG